MNSFPNSAKSQATILARRRELWALTPEERMERFAKLQAQAMQTLQSNPAAYKQYMRRNHRKRRIGRVHDLEIEMKRPRDA